MKSAYGKELRQEIGVKETSRKLQWDQAHDPNTHHNLRKVTKVISCEDCDATLGKHVEVEEI